MKKPIKPERKMVSDYRLFEEQEDCIGIDCKNCPEFGNACIEENQYRYWSKHEVSLPEIVSTYGDIINIDNIIIVNRSDSLEILIPESEESFQKRLRQYDDDIKKYNEWKINKTQKLAKNKINKQDKLKKLEQELEKLKQEIENE